MKSLPELASMAAKHWKEWLPEMTKDLKKRGEFEAATHAAAVRAQKNMRKLMDQGYQEHEAEEVVLRQQIFLEPEPEEDEEELEAERQYQEERTAQLRFERELDEEYERQDRLADERERREREQARMEKAMTEKLKPVD